MCFVTSRLQLFDRWKTSQQSHTTTRNDPLFDRGTRSGQSIVDQIFTLFHFRLGMSTDTDLSHTTCELSEAFLQLFTIVFTVGLQDLGPNQGGTTFDLGFFPGTLHHSGILGVDPNLLGNTQIRKLNIFQLQTQILEDCLAARKHSNIFQHRLATITVSRSLNSTDLQNASHFVDNQRRQGLAINVFRNNQQRNTRLGRFFEQRNQSLGTADLFFENQHATIVHLDRLMILIGDEMRREITSLELHPFDQLDFG